jgi:hypothetical protein
MPLQAMAAPPHPASAKRQLAMSSGDNIYLLITFGRFTTGAIRACRTGPFPFNDGDQMSLNRHILAALALASTILPAQAQPVMVKTFGHWGVYSYDNNGTASCYALTVPRGMQPAGVSHGNNFLLVAPKGAGGYMPQAQMGYGLKEGSEVTATVGGQAFAMTPRGNVAWLTRETRDDALVAAMKSGATLTLEATSSRGTHTQYDFSLDGVSAALKTARACR